MVPVFLFVFNYGGKSTEEIIWVWVSVAIVLAVTLFNLIKYGLKNGLLASLAELIFSVAIVFALLGILVSRNQKTKRKKLYEKIVKILDFRVANDYNVIARWQHFDNKKSDSLCFSDNTNNEDTHS